jgi:ubiquinone biosynthesis protein Coq4
MDYFAWVREAESCRTVEQFAAFMVKLIESGWDGPEAKKLFALAWDAVQRAK